MRLHDEPDEEPATTPYAKHPKHWRVADAMYTACGLAITEITRVTNMDNVTCRRCIAVVGRREISLAKWKDKK